MRAAQEQRPLRNFHILLDLFSISKGGRVKHLSLDTPTALATITAIDDSLLVAHGDKISVIDLSGKIRLEAPAGTLCLKEPGFDGPVEAEVLEAGSNRAVLMYRTEK